MENISQEARPRNSETKRYFELLDPNATSFTFQTFADGNIDPRLAAIFEGTPAINRRLKGSATLTSIEDAYKQGAGVWVTVNETDGTGRKIENIGRVRAVWNEFDGAKDGRRPPAFPLPPSMVIETSPENFHLYWLIADLWPADELGRTDFAAVLDCMVAVYGSDKAATDISRVLRVPGFMHRKNPANPHVVRLIDDNGARYTREQIVAAFPQPTKQRHNNRDDSTRSDGSWSELLRGVLTGENYHDALTRLAAKMLVAGMNDAAAVNMLRAMMQNSEGPRDERWKERYDDIPRAVKTARERGMGSADHDGWGEPINLWRERGSEAVDLPTGVVPDVVERWARDQAKRLGIEPGALAAALLAALAALVPGGNKLQMRQHDTDWTVKCILWVALIGSVGSKKSPLIKAALKSIEYVEKSWRGKYAHARAAYDIQKQASDQKKRAGTAEGLFPPTEPQLRRVIVRDATTEKLVELLSNQHDGLIYVCDELSGLFGGMDSYRPRQGRDRPIFLQAKEGGPYTTDRKIGGTHFVPNLAIGVLGAIQPEMLRKITQDAGLTADGTLQRFLAIQLRILGEGEDVAPDIALAEALNHLALNLADSPQSELYKFEPAADVEFLALQRFAVEQRDRPDTPTSLREWCDKLPNEFGRLCLLYHFIEWYTGDVSEMGLPPDELVSFDTAARARRFLTEFAYPHAVAFHDEVLMQSPAERHATKIAGYILSRGLEAISERDIYQNIKSLKGASKENVAAIQDAMRALELAGWTRPEVIRAADRRVSAWAINPAVHSKFHARAKAERERREGNRRERFGREAA
jgi:hypothetical protein